MCTVFCHKRGILYFSHEDCSLISCQYAGAYEHSCSDCIHFSNERCGLTNAPMAEDDGCCHWNVTINTSPQLVTPEMVSLLTWNNSPPTSVDEIEEILTEKDVAYKRDSNGGILVSPDDLALPIVYGIGTDHYDDR